MSLKKTVTISLILAKMVFLVTLYVYSEHIHQNYLRIL